MKHKKTKIIFLGFFLVCFSLIFPLVSQAQCPAGFTPEGMLCWPDSTGLSSQPVSTIVFNFLDWLLYIFGFLAISAFVISGIQYLTASGNENQIATAKRNMTWSVVGVVVALAGLVIVRAIDALLNADIFA